MIISLFRKLHHVVPISSFLAYFRRLTFPILNCLASSRMGIVFITIFYLLIISILPFKENMFFLRAIFANTLYTWPTWMKQIKSKHLNWGICEGISQMFVLLMFDNGSIRQSLFKALCSLLRAFQFHMFNFIQTFKSCPHSFNSVRR